MARKKSSWEEAVGVDLTGADERPPADLQPEDVRLKDGSPGYHVFLRDPEAPFVDPFDAQEAQRDFARAFNDNPGAVAKWRDQTREEVRAALGLEDVEKAA